MCGLPERVSPDYSGEKSEDPPYILTRSLRYGMKKTIQNFANEGHQSSLSILKFKLQGSFACEKEDFALTEFMT